MANYLATDTDLTSVANAIRAKGGTSAQLAFPAGFVQAIGDIPSGSGGVSLAEYFNNNPYLSSITDSTITVVRARGCRDFGQLTTINFPNCTSIGDLAFYATGLTTVSLPKLSSMGSQCFGNISALSALDLPDTLLSIPATAFANSSNLATIILRASSVVTLANISAFNNTPFASGKAGGTLYVPQSLVTEYTLASNWSTILGYTNNQIKSIESTHTDPNAPIDLTLYYAYGTPISA